MKEVQPLSTYQRGALCFLAIRRRAKTDPTFSPLTRPEIFVQSETWRRRKALWGYGKADIREFLHGFLDASNVKAGPKDHLA